ncbi:MAG: prolipoprotein diacylglyceryl transferase [Elusimicrobia bacterium]|nr:prolipoprotein diacylglyceryl transferase [Elusimicrobiota bacterium]
MHPTLVLGNAKIGLYGLCVVVGTAMGLLWLMRWREQLKVTDGGWGDFWKLLYILILSGALGGKLGFVVVEWSFIREHPGALAHTGWVYWFAVAGTMLAGRIYQLYMNKRLPRPRAYMPIADYCVTAGAIGHWLGRVGCFLNACCHGRPTDVPWGVVFTSPAADIAPEFLGRRLHPTQLYEAAAELALALFLVHGALPRIRAKRWRQGTAFLLYIILYSVMRFCVEFLRGDDRGVFLVPVLSPSQWASAAGALVAGFYLWKRGIAVRDPSLETPYLDGKP